MDEIVKAIKTKGIKQVWIAEQLKIQPSLLSMYLNKTRDCPEKTVRRLRDLLL